MAKTNAKLTVIFPDIHFPEQDETALAVALKAHSILKPSRTIQLGDILDCSAFSSHDGKTVDEMRDYDFMGMEVEPAREFIARCLKNSNRYIQLGGNHEHRIERYCMKQGVPGLATYKVLSPMALLGAGLSRSQFQYVPYVSTNDPTSYYRITKDLVAVHGWSFAKNAARIHLEQARSQSIVFGHCHRMESLSTRDPFSHKLIHSWCPGTLSKLQPLYFTGGNPTAWSHGFSLIYAGSRSWTHYTIPISQGSCVLPDGREIRV